MKTTETDNRYLSDSVPGRLQKKGKLTKVLRVSILVLAVLLVLLSFLVLALPRFLVQEISVEGASLYSESEIISCSGIYQREPVFEIDIDDCCQKILAKCRYIKKVTVYVRLTGRVVITVEEEKTLLYTEQNGKYYSFSDSFMVLEESDEPFASFLQVELPAEVSLKVGQKIAFPESASFAKTILIPLVGRLQTGPFAKSLTSVSVSSERLISFVLEGHCKVILGEYKDLDEKERVLIELFEERGGIPKEDTTIRLEDPKKIILSPGK